MCVDRVDMKGSYAFVHLKGYRLDRSIRRINPMYWKGVRLTVEFAKSNEIQKWDERKYYRKNRTLFVVNFDENKVNQSLIEDLFNKYGTLRRVSVRRNFAFVEYNELSDAIQAKSKLSGTRFYGKDLIVRYAASPDDKIREDELNARQNRRRAAIAARNAARKQQRQQQNNGHHNNHNGHNGNHNNHNNHNGHHHHQYNNINTTILNDNNDDHDEDDDIKMNKRRKRSRSRSESVSSKDGDDHLKRDNRSTSHSY